MPKEVRLKPPILEIDVRKLNLGDTVYIDGIVYLWRDRAYDRALDLISKGKDLPFDLMGSVHWHCGPISRKVNEKWEIVSAGPTTSLRFNKAEPIAIGEWGVRLVIGKGGMGKEVIEAMKKHAAAFLTAVGGSAAYYAKKIQEVVEVHWLDLGMPEAVWIINVEGFGPLTVTIDAHGNSMYDKMERKIMKTLSDTLKRL